MEEITLDYLTDDSLFKLKIARFLLRSVMKSERVQFPEAKAAKFTISEVVYFNDNVAREAKKVMEKLK